MDEFLKQVVSKLLKVKANSAPEYKIESIPLHKGQAFYLVDYKKGAITYQKGIADLLGYSEDEFDLKIISDSCHPEDKDLFLRILKAVLGFALENDVSNDAVLLAKYRFKHKNGHFIHVLSQSNAYECGEKGQVISNVCILTDISFTNPTNKLDWRFEAPGIDEEKFKKYVSKENLGFFSEREMQIIQLLKNGNSSIVIANELNISKHTVDTHRRKILKKANYENTIDLINFCSFNGII